MAKRWLVLVLAVALALVRAASSRGQRWWRRQGQGQAQVRARRDGERRHQCLGRDDADGECEGRQQAGQGVRGKDLSLVVDPGARLRIVSAEGCKTATLAQVRALPRAKVKVCGRVDRSDQAKLVFVALDVKARAATDPEPSPAPGQ